MPSTTSASTLPTVRQPRRSLPASMCPSTPARCSTPRSAPRPSTACFARERS
jgi:hypothetical protein